MGAGTFVKIKPSYNAARERARLRRADKGERLILSKEERRQRRAEDKVHVRFPIGMKLVVIITILLLLSLGAITYLVSYLVGQDVQLTAEENNFTVNQRSASEAESFLESVRSSSLMLIDILSSSGISKGTADKTEAAFFRQNTWIAALMLVRAADPQNAGGNIAYIQNEFFDTNNADPFLAEAFAQSDAARLSRTRLGEISLRNVMPFFGFPLLALYFPFTTNASTNSNTANSELVLVSEAAVVFFSPENLAANFGTGANNSSFLINGEDEILIHADPSLTAAGVSLENNFFVRSLRAQSQKRFQTRYTAEDGIDYFSAGEKLSLGNAAVITVIPADTVFAGVKRTTLRNIYLSAAVLSISILFIYFFSKSISVPLRRLTRTAGKIERGDYKIELKAASQDEIGTLTKSFIEMSKGLRERERLKDAFGRFTNKAIAEQAMRGELRLGGETKNATIFFSDIRSFTAISEKMEPAEVVHFLNEYMTRMVSCVNKTGGVVDKFIGDAVMAVWGAPMSTGSAAEDALNCVRCALMMRKSLQEFNIGRGGVKKPIIKIGCGINSGGVVAGQIGSSERMEYTVIGDAVNLASRSEALNKPLGTDIIITENTWRLVQSRVIVEEMPPVSVKGKEKPVRLFAVVNLKPAPGGQPAVPATLAQVRAMLGIKAPDLANIDMDAEEKKYKIGAQKPSGV